MNRRYRGRAVVLRCGTLGGVRVALQSKLADPYGLMGKGVTDHPIFYTHFAIPPASPFYQPGSTAKFTLRHRAGAATQHDIFASSTWLGVFAGALPRSRLAGGARSMEG